MHVCTDGSMHVCTSREGPACLLRKRSVSRERSDVCNCTCAQGGSMHVCTSLGSATTFVNARVHRGGGLCTCAQADEGQCM